MARYFAMDPSTQEEKRPVEQVEDLDRPETAIELAHQADDTVYTPWTGGLFRLYLVLILPYLCGCLNGYDGSLMGGIIAMTSYQDQFHM